MEIIKLFDEILYRKPTHLEIKHHSNSNLEDKKNELLICHERLFNHKMIIQKKGKSPLKIALMLTGHFRRFEPCAHVWKMFKDLHPNVDIFIHTWNSRGLRSQKEWISNKDTLPDFELINNILKPISFIREDHDKYIDNFGLAKKYPYKKIYLSDGQRVDNRADFTTFIMSQLYSIYTCFQNVKKFENHNNFKYDIVIKLRADTMLFYPLIFKEKLSDDCLYIHSRSHFHIDGGKGCINCDLEYKTKIRQHTEHCNDVCDVLIYGNSKVMDVYTSMYLHIHELLDKFDIDNINILNKYPELNQFITRKNNFIYFGFCGDMDKNLKLLYPERMIREYMKDYWLLSDPYYL
jgi:hypothetical protein